MKKMIIYLIKIYRKKISPMYPPRCKYVPTCSQYALEAIEKYGIIKGGLMSIWRILRCNPFSRGGFDPVKWRKKIVIKNIRERRSYLDVKRLTK